MSGFLASAATSRVIGSKLFLLNVVNLSSILYSRGRDLFYILPIGKYSLTVTKPESSALCRPNVPVPFDNSVPD